MPVTKKDIKEQLKKLGNYNSWFTRVWLVGKEIGSLHKFIDEGESIGYLTAGYDGKNNTVLAVATDRRLMVMDSGMVYGSDDRVFPYDKINSIRGERGLFFGKLRISTAGYSGDDVVITWVRNRNITKMISIVSKYMSERKAPIAQQ